MTAARTAGHSAKHVASRKHATTRKHNPSGAKTAATRKARVTAKGKHPGHAKARGFAGVGLLPVCSLEAVAMSLRLAGQRVSDDEVAGLHWLAGGDASRPVSIEAALAAAARFGLAGCRVEGVGQSFEFPRGLVPGGGHAFPSLAELEVRGEDFRVGVAAIGAQVRREVLEVVAGHVGHALILGVDVPGPHAVLATPDGWWSWGELWSPWPAQIEECWAVSWS